MITVDGEEVAFVCGGRWKVHFGKELGMIREAIRGRGRLGVMGCRKKG